MTNMDKLYEAVEARGPVCVGLDTDFSYLPADFVDSTLSKGENIVRFNKKLIDATKAVAGCYKVQIAYYESLGLEGLKAYADTLKAVREAGVPVIADIKRGDIAKTAEMYAMGHFTGDFEADFVTLAPYMGLDSISPYLPYAEKQGKGMFVLCRTSNGGAKDFEYEKLADGRHVYDLVGDKLNALGKGYMGEHGYSSIGLVIGGTHIEEATEIRAKYQDSFFLIPGYGAQGGKAEDIAQYLSKGNGGVVNSSRGILLAYKKQPGAAFDEAAYNECVNMKEAIAHACSRCEATVLRHEVIADDIRLLTALWPDREHVPHAGQFFTLRAWGADEAPFLSRPISVHKWDAETQTVEFLYAVVGEGTRKLTTLKKGDSFQLTGPMGNGFDVADILSKYKKIAVVGGGIGTAPMYQLTRELAAGGVKPDVFFGFRDKPYCMEEYRSIAGIVKVSTDTGAVGFHGFVTQLYDPADYDVVLVCGPTVMMRNAARLCAEKGTPCFVSLEKKMACGIGACLGCTCETRSGEGKSVCKNGPVFDAAEVF